MEKKLYFQIKNDEELTSADKLRKIKTLFNKDVNRKKRAHQKLFGGSNIPNTGLQPSKVIAKNLNYLRNHKVI